MAGAPSSTRYVGLDSVGLLALVRDGDNDAFGELYVRYHDFARKVAKRASRRHADDLVAESFRRVLTAITRGAGPTTAFGPYLATTIRSAAAGLAAPFQEVELTASSELVDDHGDVDPRVSTAYVSLPEQWQNALWYADVEGLSPRHAAPLMGLPSANAFSALRQRARAGLRSAYLTQVVDEACNEEVRRHLGLLVAGKTTPDVVDELVDEHLEHCDECGAIAWRIAAVTGTKVPVALAPALVAFHGFAASSSLLPAGLGLTGLLGWWRRSQSNAVATTGVVAVAAVAVVAGLVVAANRSGDPEPAASTATTSTTSVAEAPVEEPPASIAPIPPVVATTEATTTSTSSTTSTTSTTTTTSTTSTTSTSVPDVVVPPTSPPATTTAPVVTTTSTLPTTTTTVPPTTTTVPPFSGTLVVVMDEIIGSRRRVDIEVRGLSGESGSLTFSEVSNFARTMNAACDGTTCTFSGVVDPDAVEVDVRSSAAPILVVLRDSGGAVVQTYTSP